MIYFDASSYSKRTYARFRSSQALERFITSAHKEGRAASLRWVHAWMLVAHESDSDSQMAPIAPAERMKGIALDDQAGPFIA